MRAMKLIKMTIRFCGETPFYETNLSAAIMLFLRLTTFTEQSEVFIFSFFIKQWV